MKIVYECDGCHERDELLQPWSCPGCGNEVCEHCFDRFGHCGDCSEGKSDEELRFAANEAGMNFDEESDDD